MTVNELISTTLNEIGCYFLLFLGCAKRRILRSAPNASGHFVRNKIINERLALSRDIIYI